jgi:hypothetical protein
VNKRYYTQWAAQFFAAAELTRRGYLVSLTLGNAPVVDILAVSPLEQHFRVDVKGLAAPNFWLIRERDVPVDLYDILVLMPEPPAPPQFFVASGTGLMAEVRALKEKSLAANQQFKDSGAGITWASSQKYRDRWDVLPR